MPKLGNLKKITGTGTRDSKSVNLTIKDILIGDIRIKENVRKNYSGIDELAESIKQHGLLQPITIYQDEEGYVVKTGHRRFLACQSLYKQEPDRFHSVRCIISDAENLSVIQLVENVQREDLSQIDLFNALVSLRDEQGMTLKQIADLMGKSETTIKSLCMGVNDIQKDDKLLDLISRAGPTIDSVRITRGIPNEQDRLNLIEQHGKGEISREELRKKVRELKKPSSQLEKVLNELESPQPTASVAVLFGGTSINLLFSDEETAKSFEPKIKEFLTGKIAIL